MTLGDVITAVGRRFWVLLIGLLATAAVVVLLQRHPGVYSTYVEVNLVPPATAGPYIDPYPDLISMAGVLERRVNADSDFVQPVSPEATLTGMGVREGSMVMLPNQGGQFVIRFDAAVLQVRAVGPTEERAAELRDAAVDRVQTALTTLQTEQGTAPDDRVTIALRPISPDVSYLAGVPARAEAVALLLGVLLSIAAAVQADRLLVRRRERRQRRRDARTARGTTPAPV